jgi:hypothetical protein
MALRHVSTRLEAVVSYWRLKVLAVLMAAGLAGAGIVYVLAGDGGDAQPADVRFHGLVEDQDGRPLHDAAVAVHSSEVVANGAAPGGVMPDSGTAKTFALRTDAHGRFALAVPRHHNRLLIEHVRKAGYEWVTDWAWQMDLPPKPLQNVEYLFPGRHWSRPVYRPDPDRPAIFPMHEVGNPSPPRPLSRGGADLQRDGRAVPNALVVPRIPSAGPGTPRTPAEVEQRIRDYADRRNAAAGTGRP